jgi:hypothetical protein
MDDIDQHIQDHIQQVPYNVEEDQSILDRFLD